MSLIIDGSAGITFPNSTVQASAGSVLQVVTATYSTQVTTSTTGYVDTGLTATITPKFSTSKILVMVSQNGCAKDGTNTSTCIDLLLTGGNISNVVFAGALGQTNTNILNIFSASYAYLDSPATTSATTYKTRFQSRNNNSAVYVQYGNASQSSIVLMEIAV
jgi:hypothetical protein